jgi:flotillin
MLDFVLVPVVMIAIAAVIISISTSRFRIVVPTNEVHIVQSGTMSVLYGKGVASGNVYYHWPAPLPHIGVRVTALPTSVFDLKLTDYAAYDKERLPFLIDVIGFFRITDFSVASERLANIKELDTQLEFILKGAIRSILASSGLEEILEGRTQFGEMFTKEVDAQLKAWGLSTVKNLELMDVRDAKDSQVIANIMAKKKSEIERESRVKVAENMQTAQIAEIEAKQLVEVRARMSEELVGVRAAERDEAIGIRGQLAQQKIQTESAVTAEKEMAVKLINTVRQAEITRDAQVIAADQARQVTIKNAEAEKQQLTLVADGDLYQAQKAAEATHVKGEAEGLAQTAILMAPVDSQIKLAQEIGNNEGYQRYLVSLRQIEAGQSVGVEAAKALSHADVKVVSTAGAPLQGVKSVMELVTPAGAAQLGAAIESLANMPVVRQVLSQLNGSTAESD